MLWTCQQARGEKEKSRPPRGSSLSYYSGGRGGDPAEEVSHGGAEP